VDLNLYPFDYDLTLAVVLANADGTVYHRYGGRDRISPMNMDTLVDIMREGLTTHRAYLVHPDPPSTGPPQRLSTLVNEQLPGLIQPIYGCFHCHYAREAKQYLTLAAGRWTPDQFWVWPLPKTVGLILDRRKQYLVDRVLPDSPAARAGIRPGDQLQTLHRQRILTQYDLQWVLHQSTNDPISLSFCVLRNQATVSGRLDLSAGWKTGDPADYSWRVRNVFTEHMIKFLPTPGFIGEPLRSPDLLPLGLPENRFALRVTQLNRGTYLAGIRSGDIILNAGGRSDFPEPRDFYRWCELLRRSGRDIKMQLLRQGSLMNVMVGLNYLNDARVERAPRVTLGFIVQELPAGGGLRTGNVSEGSSADNTGLQVGDRIVSVEGKSVRTLGEMEELLNQKSPGDMLALRVTRDGVVRQFGFVLPGEEENRSDLARLSGKAARPGEELTCVVRLQLPAGHHVYSMHRKGFGIPTQLEFRGTGYLLVGTAHEPPPRKIEQTGLQPMWILEGPVEFRQTLRVTDPTKFQLLLRVYAQVCDDQACHEFLATTWNNGLEEGFREYHGHFQQAAAVPRLGAP